MVNRLFAELRCPRIFTVVMEVQHQFKIQNERKDVDEMVLGLLLRPQDEGLVELYREYLGINGQCRRVLTCLGFMFEFSGNSDVQDVKRVRTSHIAHPC